LLCQFLSSFTNKIENGIDGNLQNRAAIPLSVIREIKRQVPKNFSVGFRLILREWVPDGVDFPQALTFAKLLQKEGIAYLSASVGSYNSIFSTEVLKKMANPAYLRKDMKSLTNNVDVPTVISGRIIKPSMAEGLLKDGVADLIGLGRPLRADSKWVKKAYTQGSKIRTCINCNWCLKKVIMNQGFVCKRWPNMLQERTELQHKLLKRNYKGLWVIADKNDLDLFRAALPHFLPDSDKMTTSIIPTILFLKSEEENELSKEDRNDFIKWCAETLARQGFTDPALHHTARISTKNLDKTAQSEIDLGGHGVILICRSRNQPWRESLLYRVSGKVIALIGSNRRYSDILVPVDLSDTTLLVLVLLQQIYYDKTGINLQFVHVLRGSANMVQKRWQEIVKVVGFDEPLNLRLIVSKDNVVNELLKVVREGNYGTIIMGKRGLSGIKRWMLGSVSRGVLRNLTDQSLFLID